MELFRFIGLLSLFYLFISCNENAKNSDRGEVIMIDNIESKKILISDIVEEVKFFKLETDSFLVGEITDLCVYDSVMFFYDRLTWNLTAYDLQNKSVIHTINNRGNGPFEYVNCVPGNKSYIPILKAQRGNTHARSRKASRAVLCFPDLEATYAT